MLGDQVLVTQNPERYKYTTIIDKISSYEKKMRECTWKLYRICNDLEYTASSNLLTDDEQYNAVLKLRRSMLSLEKDLEMRKSHANRVPIYASSSEAGYVEALIKNALLFHQTFNFE